MAVYNIAGAGILRRFPAEISPPYIGGRFHSIWGQFLPNRSPIGAFLRHFAVVCSPLGGRNGRNTPAFSPLTPCCSCRGRRSHVPPPRADEPRCPAESPAGSAPRQELPPLLRSSAARPGYC